MAKDWMEYRVAMAAGRDAGNHSMTKAGRTAWNEDDYNAAAETTERLLGGVFGETYNMHGEKVRVFIPTAR